jgi:replicative DNA helicase Mcm
LSHNTPTSRVFDPKVTELSKDPDLIKILVEKTAPNLIGLDRVKLAVLYHLVKASRETPINILLIGDPGTGKTHLLQWAKKYHNRCAHAYIQIENINRLIKEEQRQLEVTLRGDTNKSLIASSRPLLGRYNPYKTVHQNIHLPSGVLGLFDLVFVLRDHPDREKDQVIAERILENNGSTVMDDLLADYLDAASVLSPRLSDEAKTVLQDYYLALRSQFRGYESVAITPWQLVSLRKLSEARAKLHLRERVSASDAEAAVRMLNYSLEQVGIDPVSRRRDIDVYYSGRPSVLNSKLLRVVEVFMELEKVSTSVKRVDIEGALWEQYGMTRRTVANLLRSLVEEGFIEESGHGCYKRREWGDYEH